MILINSLKKEYPNGTKALKGIDLKIRAASSPLCWGRAGRASPPSCAASTDW